MNGLRNEQIAHAAVDEHRAGFYSTDGNINWAAQDVARYNPGEAHARTERVQQYVSCLEAFLMQKNHESHEMQSSLKSSIEEAEQKLAERERVMIHQAGHAAMGKMLGLVAHKWRQPLSVISLLVQNMKDAWEYGEFDGELLDEAIFSIMEQVNRLSRTVDNFSSYLNPSGCAEYFNPKQCVKDMVTLLCNCFSNFSVVEICDEELPEKDIQVAGLHYGFQQVMHNLLCNANDAIHERKRSSGEAFSGLITVSFQRSKDDLVITVTDNGGGIDDSIREQIFEPFFSTKQNNDGFGVGLYLSKIIIENSMGGSLWCENSADGALFAVRLPVAPAERRS